jgi:hypothetical protein
MENGYLPRVIGADYLGDYKLKVMFDNGQTRIADCSKWVGGGVFEPLRDKDYFQQFIVDGWTISWKNGADIAPETLYLESEPA